MAKEYACPTIHLSPMIQLKQYVWTLEEEIDFSKVQNVSKISKLDGFIQIIFQINIIL